MDNARSGRGGGTSRYRAAAICTPGLERLCADELTALGCRPKPAGRGTVEFDATPRQLYAANTWLRTASRVVVRVVTFRSTDFAHLQRRVAEIDWTAWLADGVAPNFRVSANESKLYHTKAVAQRLHQVIGAPSTGEPEQLFVVRIDRNNVTISVDASGTPLHRRPWRTELGDAPLRATMAAAILLDRGWDGSVPLLDPFCGSGTIAIEAALLARRLPPGGERSFAFEQWPDFQPGTMASVNGEARAGAHPSAGVEIVAADRNAELVASAIANAERAGVADDVTIEARVVSHLRAQPGPGLIVTNPPYGKRVGDGNLVGLYRRFGSVVAERLPGWDLAMVCADRSLALTADRRLRSTARFRHGGLRVEIFHRAGTATGDSTAGDDAVSGEGSASDPGPPARSTPRSGATT